MKRQKNKQKQINKKANVSQQIAIILFFAGACLITLFIFAYLVLRHLM